jgi:hypothetical protein
VLVKCSSEYVMAELINTVVAVMTNKSKLVCDGESGYTSCHFRFPLQLTGGESILEE